VATPIAFTHGVRRRGKRLSVNKLTWAQVGGVTKPGRYMFKFGWLTITAEDLAIWEQFPNAAFTLLGTAATEAGEEFRLGAFELREHGSQNIDRNGET
jgi:hypothetical protein